MIGRIDANQLSSLVSDIPILKERNLCQVNFVKAVKALVGSNNSGYARELQACINYGSASWLESFYYLAKGELDRLPA